MTHELTVEETNKLIHRVDDQKTLEEILQNTPWLALKVHLKTLGRIDVTEYVEKETLITPGNLNNVFFTKNFFLTGEKYNDFITFVDARASMTHR